MTYPKYMYHKDDGSRIVHSEEDEKSLGKGWVDSPLELDEAESVETFEPNKKDKKK